MPSVGSCLREMRLRRGLSLEEIARSTRVTGHYLAALEADDFSTLPPPVFTRGFIRAYCQALGEPPDDAVALYEQRQGRPEGPGRAAPRPTLDAVPSRGQNRGRSAVFVSFLLLIVLGAALIAVTLTLQGGHEPPAERRLEVAGSPSTGAGAEPQSVTRPAAETPSAPIQPPVTAAIPLHPAPPAPASLPAPPPPETGSRGPVVLAPPAASRPVTSYRLVVKTTEPTWLRVRTADRSVSEENIPAGQTREWVSNQPFILTVGNAGGVRLELNGRALPPLGARGAVVRDFVLPREQP
jgi:cytoskeleton protein RodZ